MRIVLHVDMDYFFAAIEERENPTLKGKPVVVCVYSGRSPTSGAVSTSNYEARKLGIKSGMPIAFAMKIKPDAAFIPVNFDLYHLVSEAVMNIIRNYGKAFEQVSVDEAYVEIDGTFAEGEKLAKQIKHEILEKEKLPCSIGVGPNKLIAKMAAAVNKPNGLTVIEDSPKFIDPLPVGKIPGVGGKTEEILNKAGAKTIEQLKGLDKFTLIKLLGESRGLWLWAAARGEDNSPVSEREGREQLSRLTTLKADIRDEKTLGEKIDELSADINERVRSYNYKFRTVSILVVTSGLEFVTRSRTVNETNELWILSSVAKELLREWLTADEHPIRRLGVRASGFVEKKGQKSLSEF